MTGPDFRGTLLGTGAPIPSPNRFGSCTLIEAGDQTFLIDALRMPLAPACRSMRQRVHGRSC